MKNISLRLLVAAVTAAERGEPMPSTAELMAALKCGSSSIGMGFARLERAEVLRNVASGKGRRRVLVVGTGALTAEVEA